MLKKIKFIDILNYVLIILLFFLSIKKCGFYKTDILAFNLILEILGITFITYNAIKNRYNLKVDIIGILLLILSVCYLLPIVFRNYASLNDSIVEFTRYFNLYIMYKLILILPNKNIFKYTLIYLGVFLGIIGIDGLGNRILENILDKVNSGYTNLHLMRMSSVVQYANILAIILLISSVYVFENLLKAIKSKNKKKVILNYTLLFFIIFCLVLTQSRIVMLLTLFYYIFQFMFNKEERNRIICIVPILLAQIIVFINMAFNYMIINSTYIYYLTIIGIVVSIIVGTLIAYLIQSKYLATSGNINKSILIFFVILGTLYIILAPILTSTLKISDSAKDNVKVCMYNIEKSALNSLKININECIEDSRYRINIYEVTNKNEKKLLKRVEYYETASNEIAYEFLANDDIKSIELEFDIYKGKIEIEKVVLNEKNIKLNYILLPYELVNRIRDIIYGSDSFSTRLIYAKDALKIWDLSTKNRLFGIGGEGFKTLYQLIQTTSYTSTEVHNSYIQILVESGVFGFITISSIIIYYFIKYKNNVVKYSMILLVVHSIFDIDFSYTIILQLFAIILAISSKKETVVKESSITTIIEYITFVGLWIICFVFTLKMNLAYSLKIPVYEDSTLENQIKTVTLMEKRVMLDSSENKYRKALAIEYTDYLKLLHQQIANCNNIDKKETLIKEAQNIVENIKKNADCMKENNRYDKNNLIDISNIYFNNLFYLVNYNYSEDIENGYKEYINIIKENLTFIEDNYKYNTIAKELLNETYKSYIDNIKNSNIEHKEVIEFYNILENKITSNK